MIPETGAAMPTTLSILRICAKCGSIIRWDRSGRCWVHEGYDVFHHRPRPAAKVAG